MAKSADRGRTLLRVPTGASVTGRRSWPATRFSLLTSWTDCCTAARSSTSRAAATACASSNKPRWPAAEPGGRGSPRPCINCAAGCLFPPQAAPSPYLTTLSALCTPARLGDALIRKTGWCFHDVERHLKLELWRGYCYECWSAEVCQAIARRSDQREGCDKETEYPDFVRAAEIPDQDLTDDCRELPIRLILEFCRLQRLSNCLDLRFQVFHGWTASDDLIVQK